MNIVYLTFGPDQYHVQTNFSILTFLAYVNGFDRITVITDNPQFYDRISDGRLLVKPISLERLAEWKGSPVSLYRTKIKALEMIADDWDGDILFVDTDTFLFEPLDDILDKLDQDCSFMHLNEGKLSQSRSKTQRVMWRQFAGKSFGGITIDESHCMWNSGVVAISHNNAKRCIFLALSIFDDMSAQEITKPRVIEQFAFSVALNEVSKILPAKSYIGHYYGNRKEWNKIIGDFFVKMHLKKMSFEDEVRLVKLLDFFRIPVSIKSRNTNLRLKRLIDKIYPHRDKVYITQ